MKQGLRPPLRLALWAAAAVWLLTACDGLFGGLYDNAQASQPDGAGDGFGFVPSPDAVATGRLYLNATSYTEWTYIDLHARRVASVEVNDATMGEDGSLSGEPADWDFALHHYDVRTHGGAGMETPCATLAELAALPSLPAGAWQEDVWTTDRVIIDLSGMLDSIVVYQPTMLNMELSRWLDLDLRTMPPVYTASGRVYLLRMQDGTVAALRFANYMNAKGIKGYLTIDYLYPLTLE